MKIKALLYCTKNKWRLFFDKVKQVFTLGKVKSDNDLNGKIVAECDFEVVYEDTSYSCIDFRLASSLDGISRLDKSCLTTEQLFDYVKGKNEFYSIYIKNLHIFDETKELSDYITKQCHVGKCSTCEYYCKNKIPCITIDTPITKAPQNMMYAFDNEGNKYIVISIQSQWLCKILNKEKTIEVRKKVLKEMLNNE